MNRFQPFAITLICILGINRALGQDAVNPPSTNDLSFLLGDWQITRTYSPEGENPRKLEGTLSCKMDLDDRFVNCLYVMDRPGKTRALDRVYFNYNAIYGAYESLWLSSTWPIKVIMQGELLYSGDSIRLSTTADFPIENGLTEYVRDELKFSKATATTFARKTFIRTSEAPENDWHFHMLEEATKVESQISIRFIANEGVVIQSDEVKEDVFIDAIFDDFYPQFSSPSDSVLDLISKHKEPFTKPQLLLFTHNHRDHFAEDPVNQLMKDGDISKVAGPGQVIELLDPDLIEKSQLVQNDEVVYSSEKLNIRSYFVTHINPDFSDIENVAYLVEIGNKKILHLGDGLPTEDNLKSISDQKIDLIILPYFVLDDEVLEVLRTKFDDPGILALHLNQEAKSQLVQEISKIPSAVLLTESMQVYKIE